MEGYLYKQGSGHGPKTWRKRWFLVQQGSCIKYQAHQDSAECKNAIALTAVRLLRFKP
jgi:hypothetical protein